MKRVAIFIIHICVFVCMATTFVFAKETIIIRKPLSSLDLRHSYGKDLLTLILDATVEEYGEYEILTSKMPMQRDRMLLEMREGELLNVAFEAVKPEWEEQLLPIRIPIRKGLLGYRLFLIKEINQKLLSEIKSIEQLKQIPIGSGSQWSTARIFRENNFNMVTDLDYERLFKLLINDRFMIFPRGVNEIYDEYQTRKELYPELVVEKDLLLYFPLAEYFFVSPKKTELAKRIEKGFKLIIANGEFDKFFQKKHGELIKKSNLKGRRIFKIDNPNLSDKTPLEVEQYWFKP